MFDIIDQRVLLVVLIVGTFIVYLLVPTPNILYRDNETNRDILNFEANSGCYDMKTAEVACPHAHHHTDTDSHTDSHPDSHSYSYSPPEEDNMTTKNNTNNPI